MRGTATSCGATVLNARVVDGDGPATSKPHVGVHIPEDGELHPAAFVRGVARVAIAHGVRLFEGTPVLELDAPSPGDVRARTPEGEVRASLALVCTNAAAGRLLPFFADKVDPVRGQMLATAPAPQLFACPVYADHGYDYWRQDEHGRVVLGGWRNLDPEGEVGVDEVLHPVIQERMAAFLYRFPALRDVPVTHRWTGTMSFSRDGLPIVGPVPGLPGALAAVGFTGHGFGFAYLAGQALAALALEGATRWRSCSRRGGSGGRGKQRAAFSGTRSVASRNAEVTSVVHGNDGCYCRKTCSNGHRSDEQTA